jgi:hypothetical protein
MKVPDAAALAGRLRVIRVALEHCARVRQIIQTQIDRLHDLQRLNDEIEKGLENEQRELQCRS